MTERPIGPGGTAHLGDDGTWHAGSVEGCELCADADLAKHMVERQIKPQVAAEEMREKGLNVGTAFVDTSPDAEGFTITCFGCGRTAKLPFDPGQKVGLCPDCIKKART